jgi:hypothetical protein
MKEKMRNEDMETENKVIQNEVQLPIVSSSGDFSLNPSTMAEALEMANLMADSDMVPEDFKGKPGNVLVAVQMGSEVGLPAVQAIQNIAVINGRPALWGDAALAVVKAHSAFESIKETLDESTMTAMCTIKRKNEEARTVTFSQSDAEKAGLWSKKGPWTQYPKRMLQMRARSFALRDVFPDALKGIAIAEEVRDIPPRDITAESEVISTERKPIQIEAYPQKRFDEKLPIWKARIEAGKDTAKDIIALISSKYLMSEDMTKALIEIDLDAIARRES